MLHALTDIRISLASGSRWPLPDDLQARVDSHWSAALAGNPHLWNGRVLGTIAPGRHGGISITDGTLTAEAIAGDFASFLAWRDWGFPEIGIRNLFGSALILSADGALIYGVMGRRTANTGKIYPPGGSLEPGDVDADGLVDVVGSIERELHEETGLLAGDAVFEGMYAAYDGPRVSIGRLLRFDRDAESLVAEISANLALQEHRELETVVVLRRPEDADAAEVMPYARTFARHVLAREPDRS